MELKDKPFEEIINHILYLINFGQVVPQDLKHMFLLRFNNEINTIFKEDTKKEAIRYYEKNRNQ